MSSIFGFLRGRPVAAQPWQVNNQISDTKVLAVALMIIADIASLVLLPFSLSLLSCGVITIITMSFLTGSINPLGASRSVFRPIYYTPVVHNYPSYTGRFAFPRFQTSASSSLRVPVGSGRQTPVPPPYRRRQVQEELLPQPHAYTAAVHSSAQPPRGVSSGRIRVGDARR